MVGIILVGHSTSPAALVSAAEMIMGEQENLRSLNLLHDTNLDVFAEDLESMVRGFDPDGGVLVLCDLFGGSPANTAASLIQHGCHVVTGMNLPMLLEVLGNRDTMTADQLATLAIEAGASGMVDVNAVLSEEGNQ